jgi:hypothetical protein
MQSPIQKNGRWVFNHHINKSRNNVYSPAFGAKKLSITSEVLTPKVEDMSMQDKYNFLKYSIAWDPTVVSHNTGNFIAARLASNSKLSRPEVLDIIKSVRTHLDSYVDDSDFCSDIKWCFPKTRVAYRPTGPRSKSNS